jgi:hypothetical protein
MAGTWLELNASSSIGVADAVKNAKLVRCLFPLAALRGPTPGDSLFAMWGFGVGHRTDRTPQKVFVRADLSSRTGMAERHRAPLRSDPRAVRERGKHETQRIGENAVRDFFSGKESDVNENPDTGKHRLCRQ